MIAIPVLIFMCFAALVLGSWCGTINFYVFSILSGFIYWFGVRRRNLHPDKVFSNEVIFFLGAITIIWAIAGKSDISNAHGNFLALIRSSYSIYGILGYCLKSNIIWFMALISLGSSGDALKGSTFVDYYLNMNDPDQLVFAGVALTAVALFFQKKNGFEPIFRATLVTDLLYLFIVLCIMLVFGEYGYMIIFGLTSIGAIRHGLRFNPRMTRSFGITFFLVNLYTRFLQYFEGFILKAIFFILLGISFYFLSLLADKIWQLGESKRSS